MVDRSQGELEPGSRLGPYEIGEQIGAGGMGKVYRGRDTRLDRAVAIKVSLSPFTDRFAREAQMIASLNHANICTIYDVGPNYLVMELIEGPVLADRIQESPIPLAEALSIARQIGAALEAAHEKGIVHRDLKPANIKLRPDGSVKVLDFGLAKSSGESRPALDSSSAPTAELTGGGVILGTPGYMSPEQARGQEVDRRADIWAFGVLLYEISTGERLFGGATLAETMAAVLTREPDLERAPKELRRLLARCLEKDPRRRLRDIGDAWLLVSEAGDAEPDAVLPRSRNRIWIGAALTLAVVAAAGLVGWWRAARPVDRPLMRFSVDLGPSAIGGADGDISISQDGRRIVFPVRGADGRQQLATRLMDQTQATPLPGTEGGHMPFFSPDGEWIGYFGNRNLNKISVRGGAPVTLTAVTDANTGGAWDEKGNVVTALSHATALYFIPDAGGTPLPGTRLSQGEQTHRWPQPLPGGGLLFTESSIVTGMEAANIAVTDGKTGGHGIVLCGGFDGQYVPGGYLLYVHQGVLFAVRFDLAGRKVVGSPAPLVEDLDADNLSGNGRYHFSTAPNGAGTLIYMMGKAAPQQWNVTMLDSSGKAAPLMPPGAYYNPAFSPDGRRLALAAGPQGNDIFLYDMARAAMTRLTSDGTADRPVWTPDGTGIVYASKKSPQGLWWVRVDGGADAELLLPGSHPVVPWSISPDGKRLAYFEIDPQTGYDLWVLPLDLSDPAHPKAGRPEPFLKTQFNEANPAFSPDGRWIAYFSNESGPNEVYVRPANGAPGKWQVSNGGGRFPTWSPNGHELFFEGPDDRLEVAEYTVNGAVFETGKQRQWSALRLQNVFKGNFAMTPDGKRFAVFEAADGGTGPPRVGVLLNFLDELKRRLP